MNKINLNNITIDIHSGEIGILHSGGADSAILLYILMKHCTGKINVYTCANTLKGRVNPKIALDVISKCIDLTNNSNVLHHTYFVTEQTFTTLFANANNFLKDVSIMYTGATAFPPLDILHTFKNNTEIFHKRNPNELRPLYTGKYYAPFFNHNKKDIFNLYTSLELIDKLYPITRSCEDLKLRSGHCGNCWWCEERIWAFGKLE